MRAMDSQQPNSASPLWTRRDCTLLGMKVFAASVAAAALLTAAPALLHMGSGYTIRWTSILIQTFSVIFVAAPPAALFGSAVGFELYRLAAGSRQPRETGCVTWTVGCLMASVCFLGPLVMLFYLQSAARKNYILQSKSGAWAYPVFYIVIMMCISLWTISAVNHRRAGYNEDLGLVFGLNCFLALFLADSIMVMIIGRLTDKCLLAEPQTHRFQFSLGTMMLVSLGLGAYISGLINIFGK